MAHEPYLESSALERLEQQVRRAYENSCGDSGHFRTTGVEDDNSHSPMMAMALSLVVANAASFVYTVAALLMSFWSKFGNSCVT